MMPVLPLIHRCCSTTVDSPYKAGLLRLSRDVRYCFKIILYYDNTCLSKQIPYSITRHIDAVACCKLAHFAIEELVDTETTKEYCAEMFLNEI